MNGVVIVAERCLLCPIFVIPYARDISSNLTVDPNDPNCVPHIFKIVTTL